MVEQPLTSQEQLAQEITDALFEAKLIAENKRNKLPQQIAMGLLDTDDWTLLVDIATESDANKNKPNNAQNDNGVKGND